MEIGKDFKLKTTKAQSIVTDTYICPNCQLENRSGEFCSECGTRLERIYKLKIINN